MLLGGAAHASGPEIRYAELVLSEDQYIVNADIEFELSSRLEEVLQHGIPLHFVAECIVTRPRWYWWDEKVIERRLPLKVSYHALTQQYRLAVGALAQSYQSLDEVLRTMRRIRNWAVLDREALRIGESFNVALRFRLDNAQLPKPFQVTAIGSRDWDLETPWLSWVLLSTAQSR